MPVVEVPGIGNVHFPDDTPPADMAKAIQGLVEQTKAAGKIPDQGVAYRPPAAQAAPMGPMVSAEQVLQEENRPVTRGLEAGAHEAIGAAGDIAGSESGILQRILGLARGINVPAVAAGGAMGTGVQNILARVPGLGGAAGAVPAAGAALTDAATQLVSGPAAIRGGTNIIKGLFKGGASILAPGVVRQAGREAVADVLGAPRTAIERVFTTPKSKVAYQAAEAQGPVKTGVLGDITQETFFKEASRANPSNEALTYISNLQKKFSDAKSLGYSDVMEEVQSLKARADAAFNAATPDNVLGKTLMEAREHLINALDKNTAYRAANKLYRKEQATTDIMNSMRTATPGTSFEKLLDNSPDVAKAFSKAEIGEIQTISNALNNVASATPAGGFRQILAAMSEIPSNMLASKFGRALLRRSLSSTPGTIPETIALSAQIWRASPESQ